MSVISFLQDKLPGVRVGNVGLGVAARVVLGPAFRNHINQVCGLSAMLLIQRYPQVKSIGCFPALLCFEAITPRLPLIQSHLLIFELQESAVH